MSDLFFWIAVNPTEFNMQSFFSACLVLFSNSDSTIRLGINEKFVIDMKRHELIYSKQHLKKKIRKAGLIRCFKN